jgi:hypothetical protein
MGHKDFKVQDLKYIVYMISELSSTSKVRELTEHTSSASAWLRRAKRGAICWLRSPNSSLASGSRNLTFPPRTIHWCRKRQQNIKKKKTLQQIWYGIKTFSAKNNSVEKVFCKTEKEFHLSRSRLLGRRSIFESTLMWGSSSCTMADRDAIQPLIDFVTSDTNCCQEQKKLH